MAKKEAKRGKGGLKDLAGKSDRNTSHPGRADDFLN